MQPLLKEEQFVLPGGCRGKSSPKAHILSGTAAGEGQVSLVSLISGLKQEERVSAYRKGNLS